MTNNTVAWDATITDDEGGETTEEIAFPYIAVGVVSGSPEYLDKGVSSLNANAYTYANKNLGTEFAGRKLLICVAGGSGGGNRTVASVKVHTPSVAADPTGTSATEVVAAPTGPWAGGIWEADLPTGTVGDVVVTYNGLMGRASMAIFNNNGLLSPVNDVAAALSVANGGPANLAIDVVEDGYLLVYCFYRSSSAGTKHSAAMLEVSSTAVNYAVSVAVSAGQLTWTGATELFDDLIESFASGLTLLLAVSYSPTPPAQPLDFTRILAEDVYAELVEMGALP